MEFVRYITHLVRKNNATFLTKADRLFSRQNLLLICRIECLNVFPTSNTETEIVLITYQNKNGKLDASQ
jgi:hypothetical protein